MKIPSYSKVRGLGHPQIAELFNEPVIIQEKVDGSQFSFMLKDGVLHCRSKTKDQTYAPDKMFEAAKKEVEQLDLREGWIYRGELLNRPKHNTLAYSRAPKHFVVIFDIDITGQTNYLSYEEVRAEATRIDLEVVPKLFEGKVSSAADLEKLLDTESFLGGTKIEGVVCKNYQRWSKDGKTIMGKLVQEKFKERNQKDFKDRNPTGKDIVDQLISEFQDNEARWVKAIQHLDEQSKLAHDPSDIGKLIKEIQKDLLEEEKEYIKERLFKWAWPRIYRKAVGTFPTWYKSRVMKDQFNEEEGKDVSNHS